MNLQLPNTQANPETVNISVNVTDGENAIPNATVSIGETSSTTGSAGGCTLNNIPVGDNTINVSAEGYEDYSETITVSNEKNTFTITLTEE